MATLACSVCLLAASRPAAAGAWNRHAGEGLAIFDYTLGTGTDYFDGTGHLAPARSYSKSELAAYVEYGATDRLTLIARPALDDVHVGEPDPGRYCSAQKLMALRARYDGTDFCPLNAP